MRVAFSVGKSSGDLINKISKYYDNAEFYTYNNVRDLIKESNLRHIYFDRIVYSEKLLRNPEEDLKELNNYIVSSSDSTTIVLIAERKDTVASQLFQEIFNSPLYTVVVMRKADTFTLCDLVGKDILEVKTKYFDMVGNPPQNEAVEPSTTKSKSRFGIFVGKNSKTGDSKNTEDNPLKAEETGTQTTRGDSFEKSGSNSINYKEISSLSDRGSSSPNYEVEENRGFADRYPSSPHSVQENEDFSSSFSDDDYLGLGKFGIAHSDTGYLNEEDSDFDDYGEASESSEINQKKERNSDSESSKKQKLDSNDDSDKYDSEDKDNSESESRFSDLEIRSFSKVMFVSGERGIGVTTYVADLVYELFNRGESVLVVDCDYKRNGILSFIDVRDFYEKGHEDGIDSVNPYVDEEADIISNGYGSLISKSSIVNLLNDKRIQSAYDRIIIDCPLDCINTLSERVVRGNTFLVLAKGDRVSLTATSISLTDRVVVEVNLEKYIMQNCTVALSSYTDYLNEDIEYIKETILFPNGCWLDNIGV